MEESMSKPKVYIDGQEGTTGLQLKRRLERHPGVELIEIDPALRKDEQARLDMMRASDLTFLCLPDAAAVEAAAMAPKDVKLIDASTAHRTARGWAYGMPELSAQHRAAIASSARIANPGCHATGFISIVYPLVKLGILSGETPLCCHSITGYSGGGKKMIAQYEAEGRDVLLDSPRQYGLGQTHKHLPEMQKVCALAQPPVFAPIVCDFYSGMAVTVPLHSSMLQVSLTPEALASALEGFYDGSRLISVQCGREDGFIAANELAGTCRLKLYVTGGEGRINVTSVFDNLGKGASGAAVQNMNIALGLDEYETLGLIME